MFFHIPAAHPASRLCLASAILALAACNPATDPQAPATVTIGEALCRPTPNGRDVTACYVTLTASQDDRLVSASSPIAGLAQVHEMKTEDGIMTMVELKDGLPLSAGDAVSLRPGGAHIMLMQLKQPLAVGDQVSLTLTFEHAPQIGIRAAVGQPTMPAAGHTTN